MSLAEDVELLYKYVADAASRGAITELLYLWAPTPWLEERGVVIRTAVNSVIPCLADHFHMSVDRNVEFPSFIKLYDEHIYNQYGKSPNKALVYFSRQGNLRGVRTAISKKACNFLVGVAAAIKANHKDILEFFVEQGYNRWDEGLYLAAEANNEEFIEYFFAKGATARGDVVRGAAAGGHLHLVKRFFQDVSVINTACLAAVFKGHKEVVEYFVEQGFDNWSSGMLQAAAGGHIELVEYFISRLPSAHLWNTVLMQAADNNQLELVKYAIQKGAYEFEDALINAITCGSFNVVKHLLQYSLGEYNKYLYIAARNDNEDLVKYFIGKGGYIDYVLSLAAQDGELNAVILLVKLGATNIRGAIEVAKDEDEYEVIEYLTKVMNRE